MNRQLSIAANDLVDNLKLLAIGWYIDAAKITIQSKKFPNFPETLFLVIQFQFDNLLCVFK